MAHLSLLAYLSALGTDLFKAFFLLRFSRVFIETLIKCIPWLSDLWKETSTEQTDLFKKIQAGTRQLQVCLSLPH
jgi:hypothetical protein